VTLTTVGYGALSPTTTEAKMFTVVYLFVGVALLMEFINAASELRRDRNQERLERRRDSEGT
jgi:voltage-gated potassium channel